MRRYLASFERSAFDCILYDLSPATDLIEGVMKISNLLHSINGVVVTLVVAIDQPRVRFSLNAAFCLFLFCSAHTRPDVLFLYLQCLILLAISLDCIFKAYVNSLH